ncbi:MAG: hypothetical protein K9J13_17435 [Saprospiraceae bacterium]|nr:hypothetical protein [Saprospiraceae bacterium]
MDYKQHKIQKSLIGNLKLLMLVLFLITIIPAKSQFYNGSQLTFGKNRVQYGERLWFYYRFSKFDTYFYKNGTELAEYAAKYATIQIPEIEKKLDFILEDKIQFIIYNKLSDLKESNIGLINDEQYNIGGITYINGTKVFIYFTGDHREFEEQINAGIINVILNQMMFGTKLASVVKNSTLLSLPEWYTQGLISYLSKDWSTEIDNSVKDGILSGRYERYNQLTGTDAVNAGHSIWKFIADKYGEQSIPNIIYMTKISRNVESGFLFVLGISFKNLINQWISYYNDAYTLDDENRENPSDDVLLKKIKSNRKYSQIKISPNARHIAFTTNQIGKYKVLLYDSETKKLKKILKSGYRLDEKVDYSYPLIAWHPTGLVLSIIVESKGKILLYHYSLETKKLTKRQLFNMEKILDFSYNHNGTMMVMSAVQKGTSDIFVYHLASNSYQRITSDVYDDFHPQFINNSKDIVFSSNRLSDTIRFDIITHKQKSSDTIKIRAKSDIFIYDYYNKKPVLRRITNTPDADEIQPMAYQNQYLTYLGDKNGIQNRYIARFDSAISYIDTTTHYKYFAHTFPVTDYSRNILEQDVSPVTGKYAEVIFSNGLYKMYVKDMVDVKDIKKLDLENTYYINQLIKASQPKQIDSTKIIRPKSEKKKKQKGFSIVVEGEEDEYKNDSTNIDINDYKFGDLSDKNSRQKNESHQKSALDSSDAYFGNILFPKQLNYEVEYSINQLVTQVDFSFLNSTYQTFSGGGEPIFINPGFNGLFKVGVMDLLEDYRITGGVRLSVSLDNNEYFLSFNNLKKRLDKEVIFHRKSIQNIQYYSIIKTISHEAHYVLKWPFSNVASIRGSGMLRNDRAVNMAVDLNNLLEPTTSTNWGGLKTEFVYDNTRNKGLNIYYGTRYKVFAEYYQSIEKENKELIVLGLDYRYYQKIHKTFIWANRIAASTSFGNNKLIYYMGGVDNWLFPKFNQTINIDYSQNYAYQTLATNMRGFTQNIRNGNSFAVLNSELRFPPFQFFSNKPIKSEFLNNFQIVGFGDIGTAWTGLNPYSNENSLYTKIIDQQPMYITIQTQREPMVGGYGFGVRSKLLGYFIRADWAWGVEDGIVQPSIFYLSLSLDF